MRTSTTPARAGIFDAVYITLPNSRHREYTERAALAGVHVLCEKPMAVTSRDCAAMIRAAEAGGVRLMIAYRLHFEPANMRAVELVRRGALGRTRQFHSAFSMQVRPGNIRLRDDLGGGPLADLGIYCINAARYLFGANPTEATSRVAEPLARPLCGAGNGRPDQHHRGPTRARAPARAAPARLRRAVTTRAGSAARVPRATAACSRSPRRSAWRASTIDRA